MKVLSIIICLIICFDSFGQTDSSFQPIEEWIQKHHRSGQVIYANKLSDGSIDQILGLLKSRTYKTVLKDGSIHSIALTKNEHKHLIESVRELRSIVFENGLFINSINMPEDSVLDYLSAYVKPFRDKLADSAISEKEKFSLRQAFSWPNIFIFSKPILLRNNTISLIYTFRRYGFNGGEYLLTFYKKLDGVWTKWVVVEEGYL